MIHPSMTELFAHSDGSTRATLIDTLDPRILVQVFDRIALPTFILDANHVVIHWNSAMEALSGIDRNDIVGTQNQWKPFYSTPRPCLADLILEGGQDEDVERYYRDKYQRSELIPNAYEAEDFFPECGPNGEWLHFTAASILSPDGKVIGAIETLTNISARKQAEFDLQEREKIYKELSIRDSLTQLYNSRHFYVELHKAIETYRRMSTPFAICFFDLDKFKALNDTHGHLAGDRVLERFGSILSTSLRSPDRAFRYGGEEFVALLPASDLEGASVLADRIRETFKDTQIELSNGLMLNCTVSIGVTVFQSEDTKDSLIDRADRALYQAKEAGRDRTVGV